ncbi:hypothetical protein [Pedobacter sp. NJ-S-72]
MEVYDTKYIKSNERSFAMYQMLGEQPSWLIKYGVIIMTLIVGLLIAFSFIVKYPDLVKGQFILSSNQTPQRIVVNTSGKLKLFVRNGQTINSGDILGALSSSANLNDVFEVKKKVKLLLNDLGKRTTDYVKLSDINNAYILGVNYNLLMRIY